MTMLQETASAQKSLNSDRALSAPFEAIWPFQAMLAGLVVVLVAAAVMSQVVVGRPTDTTIVSANNAGSFAPGYPLHGGLAGPSRVAINDAGSYGPGYPLHGGLAGPSRVAIDEADASIQRFLLVDDQAAAGGSGLRIAPQPADGATDGGNQRFVLAD